MGTSLQCVANTNPTLLRKLNRRQAAVITPVLSARLVLATGSLKERTTGLVKVPPRNQYPLVWLGEEVRGLKVALQTVIAN